MTYDEHQSPPPPPLEKGLDSKVAVLGFFYLCLNVLFFSCLPSGDPWAYRTLFVEDGLAENLTAVEFFLAGILLFATASAERRGFRRGLYMLGGMAMLFVCGEEISWGQRIFGFVTPDFLMDVNWQGEFNVHNVHTVKWRRLRQDGPLLLCMVTGAAFLCRKDRLFGIPLPSVPLVLGLLVGLSLSQSPGTDVSLVSLVFMREKALLFVAIYAWLSKQGRVFMVTVASAVFVLAVSYVEHRVVVHPWRVDGEWYECLLGIVCLFYSLELLLAQRRLSARSRAPFTRLNLSDKWSVWLMICSVLIGGSIGLVLFGYEAVGARTAALMDAYRAVRSAEPVIRSDFDVYLMRNQLVYLKEPCDPADTEPRFFLHVTPADANDLSRIREPHGFDNLDFDFVYDGGGISFGGKCLVTTPLPDYTIATIRTGQFIRKKGKIWIGTFTVNE